MDLLTTAKRCFGAILPHQRAIKETWGYAEKMAKTKTTSFHKQESASFDDVVSFLADYGNHKDVGYASMDLVPRSIVYLMVPNTQSIYENPVAAMKNWCPAFSYEEALLLISPHTCTNHRKISGEDGLYQLRRKCTLGLQTNPSAMAPRRSTGVDGSAWVASN